MTVSIALCTYNGEKFLREQLASLLNQTVLPDEVIIADDGSYDSTLQIVEEFSRNAPFRVRLLEGRVGGPTQNFERAMVATTGEIVLLCDQDDIWHRSKVEEFDATFRATPSLMCVLCDANLVDSMGHSLKKTLWQSIGFAESKRGRFICGDYSDFLLKRTIAFGLTMGLRRSVIDHLSPIPMPFGHDNFSIFLAAAMGEIGLINHSLLDYRQHAKQVSGAQIWKFRTKAKRNVAIVPTAHSFEAAEARLLTLPESIRGPHFDRLIGMLEAKANHLEFREHLDENRMTRLAAIHTEWAKGGYQKYSNGLLSVLKDLF